MSEFFWAKTFGEETVGGCWRENSPSCIDFGVFQKLPKHQEKRKKHVQSFSFNIYLGVIISSLFPPLTHYPNKVVHVLGGISKLFFFKLTPL